MHTKLSLGLQVISIIQIQRSFYKSPKYWHNYITTLLYAKLKKNAKNLEHYFEFLTSSTKVLAVFKNSTKMNLASNMYSKKPCTRDIYVVKKVNVILSTFASDIYCTYGMITYLHFNLDSRLRLHIYFYTIYFSSGQENCRWDRLEITNEQSRSDKKKGNFVYCGFSPSFNFYIKNNQCEVYFRYVIYMHIFIHFNFSIFDQRVKETSPQSIVTTQRLNNKYVVQNSTFKISYFLQQRKIDQILLKVNSSGSNTITVYDGPGLELQILKAEHDFFATSTFQCLVDVSGSGEEKKKIATVKFKTQKLTVQNIYEFYNQINASIQLPNLACMTNICVLSLQASPGYQINITVNSIMSRWVSVPICSYGGLVTAEIINNDYHEGKIQCDHYDGSKQQSKSYFSLKSSMYLILYWYDIYNEISSSVTVQTTRCKPVRLDPCIFFKLCVEHVQAIKCKAYLNTFTKYLEAKLMSERGQPTLQFFLGAEECVVVQLATWNPILSKEKRMQLACKLNLIAESSHTRIVQCKGAIPPPSHTFQYTEVHFLTLEHYPLSSNKCPKDQLRQKALKIESSNITVKRTDGHLETIFMKLQNKIIKDLYISLPLMSSTWLDILIRRYKSDHMPSFGVLSDLSESYHSPLIGSPLTFKYTDIHIMLVRNKEGKTQDIITKEDKKAHLLVRIERFYKIYNTHGFAQMYEKRLLWNVNYKSEYNLF